MDHDYQQLITVPNLIILEQKKNFEIDEHIISFLQRNPFLLPPVDKTLSINYFPAKKS